jgi:hypothetical protein
VLLSPAHTGKDVWCKQSLVRMVGLTFGDAYSLSDLKTSPLRHIQPDNENNRTTITCSGHIRETSLGHCSGAVCIYYRIMPQENGHLQSPLDGKATLSTISEQGDVVLHVMHTSSATISHSHAVRVNSSTLKAKSRYFASLLDTGRFGEGEQIALKHGILREKYPAMSDVPSELLPTIRIEDLGRISAVKSIEPLLTDFFNILHGHDTASAPPVGNLANLAIVADRFDALDAVATYMRRKRILKTIDAKTLPKQDIALTEERVRQRTLVALLLDYPPWLEKYSIRIIVKGWVSREADLTEPLWWDLPLRIEEELAFRRNCILETIQSLQDYFLGLYSSRTRMCRLGYDSSPECDSFQFGEMARFFLRSGTLKMQSSIIASEDPPAPYDGDLTHLIEKLKQIPEYQVNSHHSHCGIRTQIVPLLDLIAATIQQVGICGECWNEDRRAYAWNEAKRPLIWKRAGSQPVGSREVDHGRRHVGVREMMMAGVREWL